MAANADAFLGHLDLSHLLTSEQMAAVRTEFGAGKSPQEIARALTDRGLLTRWQAKMLLAGRKAFFLGKYKLLDQLGQGGMGTVFKAEQAGLGRIVALKVMASQLLRDKGAVARFHREIQAAAALDHPNIVAAYDADCFKDTHFLVMEYVEGKSLDDLAKKHRQLPIGDACEYVRQAALGLQHAHEKCMVHRDIKPANLLLTSPPVNTGGPADEDASPVVKILDMGLARFSSELSEEGALTQTGQIMGTPDYIAPEQAQNTKLADIRSDIFSLGCTLFRLITGQLPFRGANVMEKLMARTLEDAPRVRSLRPDVPLELDAIVAKMLARAPAARYQTPAEVAAALVLFSGQSLGNMTMSGGITSATLTSAGVSSWQAYEGADTLERVARIDPGLDKFLQQLATEAADEDEAPAEEHDTSRIQQAATQTGTPEKPSVAPAPARPPKPATKLQSKLEQGTRADRKQVTWIAVGGTLVAVAILAIVLWNRAGTTELIVELPEEERQADTIEIDGAKQSLLKTGELRFRGEPGKRTLRLSRKGFKAIAEEWEFARGETKTFRPEWEPTAESLRGRRLAELRRRVEKHSGSNPQAKEARALRTELIALVRERPGTSEALASIDLMRRLPWPADALRREDIRPDELLNAGRTDPQNAPAEIVAILGDSRLKHWASIGLVAYTQDGKLVTKGNDLVIRIWDRSTGRLQKTLPAGEGATSVAPTGKFVATGNKENSLDLWDLDRGEMQSLSLEGNAARPESSAFSEDGTTLAVGMSNGEIVLWNPAERKVSSRFPSGTGHVRRVVLSPKGDFAAGFGDDFKIRVWTTGDGQTKRTFSPATTNLRDLVFDPTGKLLACGLWIPQDGMGTAHVWDVENGNEVLDLPKFTACSSVAFSPDGKLFAAGMEGWDESGHVACWEVEGGRELWQQRLPGEISVRDLSFSPDGGTLAISGEAGRLHFRGARTGEVLTGFDRHHESRISSLAWSADGETLVSGSLDMSAIVWDVATQSPRHTLRGHELEVYAVAISPEGNVIATTGRDGRVNLWDAKTGEERRRLFGHTYRVGSLVFSPDGKLLLSGGWDAQAILWDVEKGLEVRKLPESNSLNFSSVAFHPSGSHFATATWGRGSVVRVWETTTMKRVWSWEGLGDGVNSVDFSPNGAQLIAASPPVKRFDLKTGKETLLQGDRPQFLKYSPDGRRVALQRNGRLVVADPDLFAEDLSIPMEFDQTAVFSPEGRHLATANGNGTIYVIRLPDESK